MPKPPDPDLFAAAGLEPDVEHTHAKPKRPRKAERVQALEPSPPTRPYRGPYVDAPESEARA